MASTIPPGKDLGNHGPEINRVAAVFGALGTLAVVARLISRKLQKSYLRASDYTIMLGMLFAWGPTITIFIGILILLHEQQKSLRNLSF